MATRASAPERLKKMDGKKLKKYAEEFSRTGQKVSDSNMANASAYKNFEADGGNRYAIKIALALGRKDPAKAHTDFMDIKGYVKELFPEIADDLFVPASEKDDGKPETLDPLIAGKSAYQMGASLAANPHSPKSEDGVRWANGWKQGETGDVTTEAGLAAHQADGAAAPEALAPKPHLAAVG